TIHIMFFCSVTREGLLLAEWPGGSAVDRGSHTLDEGKKEIKPGTSAPQYTSRPRSPQRHRRSRERPGLQGVSASPLGKKSCLILIYYSPSASLHWIHGTNYGGARVLY